MIRKDHQDRYRDYTVYGNLLWGRRWAQLWIQHGQVEIYSQGTGWGNYQEERNTEHKEGSECVWVNPPNRVFAEDRPGWLDKEPDQILWAEFGNWLVGKVLNKTMLGTDGPRKFRSLTKVFVKQRNFVQSDQINDKKDK